MATTSPLRRRMIEDMRIRNLARAAQKSYIYAVARFSRQFDLSRQWKVIETVRGKFTYRDCEKISQAPAPFHVIARGWAGASLLPMIVFEKFGQHRPLNRQVERYVLEGVRRSRCRRWPTRWARSARRSIRSSTVWKLMSWR